jgi:enamine deaminase RidA (YjgF/YER057c/UK114 family)
MSSTTHFNPTAGSLPYKGLFSSVSIVPAGCSLAYISTQWAADPVTGELIEGIADDYAAQSKVVWTNICEILKELGVGMKDVVHRTVSSKQVDFCGWALEKRVESVRVHGLSSNAFLFGSVRDAAC